MSTELKQQLSYFQQRQKKDIEVFDDGSMTGDVKKFFKLHLNNNKLIKISNFLSTNTVNSLKASRAAVEKKFIIY